MDFSTKKENINYYNAIKLISLDNTLKLNNSQTTSREYDLDRIFRGYSRKFHTSLHVVYTLPLHNVLTAYFDDLFENMEPEQLEEVRIDLLKSEEDRIREKSLEEDRELGTIDLLEEMSREAEQAQKKIEALTSAGIKPLINNKAEPALGNPLLEPTKLMPDIKLKFISEEEMNESLNSDSLGLLEDL